MLLGNDGLDVSAGALAGELFELGGGANQGLVPRVS